MRKFVITKKYINVWRCVYLIITVDFFVVIFFSMIILILLTLIPCVLTMNTISAFGHSVLWKKYGRDEPSSAATVKAETPHSSPPQPMDTYQPPCSPLTPCDSNRESLTNVAHRDTPKSIDIEPLEEHHQPSPPSVISRE
jgi:hypothetical protein